MKKIAPLLRLRSHVLGCLSLQSIVQENGVENDGSDDHRTGTEEAQANRESGDDN